MVFNVWVNSTTAPSGADLVKARGLWVCDKDNLKGGGANVMQPVKAAWAWDTETGSMRQFWPPPPTAPSITVGAGTDWRYRAVSWSSPSATSYSVTAKVGTNSPVVIYTGSGTSLSWNWFNQAAQFQPGATVVISVSAANAGGTTVASGNFVLPTVPAPSAAPTYASTDHNSTVASWPSVPGAISYQVVNNSTGAVVLSTTGVSGTIALGSPSTTYTFKVRAVVQATYSGSTVLYGAYSATRSVTSSAAPETGPANGTYTIEPASNATYQWGESGGQSAQWRPTSDDLYHGDGGSVSTRGQQAAFFFYGTRITGHAELGGGLGTKTVTRVQIYVKRLSSGGSSSAQACRWMLHNYASKPSGAPSTAGGTDIGSLAWGEGEWFDLPVSWGRYLIEEDYKGIAWGKVAARYMIADSSLGLATPNGTIKITIGD